MTSLRKVCNTEYVQGLQTEVCKHAGVAGTKIALRILHHRYHDADYLQKSSLISLYFRTSHCSMLADFCLRTSYEYRSVGSTEYEIQYSYGKGSL